jgi:hypothetical protein
VIRTGQQPGQARQSPGAQTSGGRLAWGFGVRNAGRATFAQEFVLLA